MEAVIYNFKDMEHFVDVENILHTIGAKDNTLKIKKIDEVKMEIILEGDKDSLHKKCTWIIHKADKLKRLVYKIVK